MHKFNLIHKYMNRKMDEAGKPDGGGGDEPKPEPTPGVEPTPDADKVDDLGYAIVDDKSDKPEEKAPEEPKADEDIKDPATGYGEDPPEVPKDEPKEEPKPDDKEEPKEGELELNVEGLEKAEVESIREFAKKHSVTKEVAQAMIDRKKAENAAQDKEDEDYDKELKVAKSKREAAYHKDLKEDSDFGGDKFAFNIKRSEKVLDEFLPLTKKALTDGGGMLPPYVMRDLAKLANHLYSKENLTHGDPSLDKREEEKSDDPLDFYGS